MLEAFLLILVHFIADFICQDEKWANNKSTSIRALLSHTLTYSAVFCFICLFIPQLVFQDSIKFGLFILSTFVFHSLTDFITSKIVKSKFDKKEYGSNIPNFGAFTVIGIDQVLHYGQLFGCYHIFSMN